MKSGAKPAYCKNGRFKYLPLCLPKLKHFLHLPYKSLGVCENQMMAKAEKQAKINGQSLLRVPFLLGGTECEICLQLRVE